MKAKRRILVWGLVLAGSFLLCRFGLFSLHGMKQWPAVLAGVGLIILLAAGAMKGRRLATAAALGYLLRFGVGLLFRRQGLDPGGGRTDSLWLIWIVCYLLCLAAGGAWDLALKRRGG